MVKELKVALGMCMSESEMRRHNVNIDCLNDIQDYLWVYFMRVAQHSAAAARLLPNVGWFFEPSAITSRDLVVYFVANRSQSIIKKLGHSSSHNDIGGLTLIGASQGTVSEVYVEKNFPPKKLAHIAFHELMHNKTGRANDLHSEAHVGLGKSPAGECSVLTDSDMKLMAQRLNTPVKQYAAALTGDVAVKFKGKPGQKSAAVLVCPNGSKPEFGFLNDPVI